MAMTNSVQSPNHQDSDRTIFANGHWIWTEAQRPNHYAVFAKTVPLRRQEEVHVRITASSYYDLFLNGNYIARGPVHGDPRWCLPSVGAAFVTCILWSVAQPVVSSCMTLAVCNAPRLCNC